MDWLVSLADSPRTLNFTQNSKDILACQLSFAVMGTATSNINTVVITAELRHQAQTAWITKISRQVRYMEKTVPKRVRPVNPRTDR
jgi:hypothetical protein